MMNIIKSIRKPILWFLLIEGGLYLLFLMGDLLGFSTDGLKYLAIALCAGLAVGRARRSREWFVPAALLLTLAADACLLFGGPYLVGVVLFCGVQTLYAARLMWWRGRVRQFVWQDHMQSVAWRVFLYGVSLIALRALSEAGGTERGTPLNAAALRSFSQLTVSAVEAWHLKRFDPRVRTFAVGLSLFWACDLCVGLRYVLMGSQAAWRPMIAYGIWFFYLPAQVCIALSDAVRADDSDPAAPTVCSPARRNSS